MSSRPYRHGAVLLLEPQDSPDSLRPTCRAMREVGLNTVVVWPPVFYREGKRDFSVQHALCQVAAECGLQVIIELTGQVANLEVLPDAEWSDDLLGITAEGLPARTEGGLGELNYNHPEVQHRMDAFLRECAAALRDEPALVAWDVWNETHFRSYDPYTLTRFHDFLRSRYPSIEALNGLWKKSYSDFSQIRYDSITWASITPDLDWEEFRTENLAHIAHTWASILHQADPTHPVIADNVMSQTVWSEFSRGTDDWKLANAVDSFGISFYPKTGGRLLNVNEPWLRLLCFAGARSAGSGHFLISELQSHCYSEIFTTERVSPDELITWNFEALFSGSTGSIYWKWNPFKSGFQVGGRGLVLADGSPSKRSDAVHSFASFLQDHPSILPLRPSSHAAILFDPQSNRAVKAINNRIRSIIGDDHPLRARYAAARGAWRRNISLSVLTPEQLQTERPSLLLLPYQVCLSDDLASALSACLAAGSTLVATYPFGDISPQGRLYENIPGGPLSHLLRCRQIDHLQDSFQGEPLELQELEILPHSSAEILLRTDAGRPLLLRYQVGAGTLLYVASSAWLNAWDSNASLLESALWNAILQTCPSVPSIQASLPTLAATGADGHTYLWIHNQDAAPSCIFSSTTTPTLLFGSGSLLPIQDSLWQISDPHHAILRL